MCGCKSYSPQPLDLDAHRSRLAKRLSQPEPLLEFAARLADRTDRDPARFDIADGMTLAEGEVVALFYNPDLRLARLGAGVTLATAEHVGRWQDPEFGFDGAEVLSPEGPFEYGLTLSLTIPVSGRLALEAARARAEHQVELRRIVDQEWTVRSRVRLAWAAWSAAQERAQLLEDASAKAESLGRLVDTLEKTGTLRRVESRMMRTAVARMRADTERAVFEAERNRIELFSLMGVHPRASVELIPAVAHVKLPEDQSLDRLIAANTSLAVHRAEHEAAERALRLEIRKQYPDLVLGGGYGYEDGDQLLLGIGIRVPIWNRNAQGIAEARAQRELVRARGEVALERLAGELAFAQSRCDSSAKQVRLFETELIPAYQAQAGEIETLASLGEVDVLLMLESIRAGLDVREQLITLRLDFARSRITLAHLLGTDMSRQPVPVRDGAQEPQP